MLIVTVNPRHASKFIGHFKAEVAHRMNIILGWRKRTVWCEGYDSPIVLSALRAFMAITYLYGNASKDCQEDTIDLYPGLTSWKMFLKGEHQKKWRFIRRPAFKPLTPDAHNLAGYTRESERVMKESKKDHTFTLSPNAWLEAFGITTKAAQKEWNENLVTRVRQVEQRHRSKRKKEGKHVIGKTRLLNQPLTLDHQSKRGGKRMWCLSEKRSERQAFIRHFKALLLKAREVYTRWHQGDYSVSYPLGLFPPAHPPLAELWIAA